MGQGAWLFFCCCCCLLTGFWHSQHDLWAGDTVRLHFCWLCRPSSSRQPPPQPAYYQDYKWPGEDFWGLCSLNWSGSSLSGPLIVAPQVCACSNAAPRIHLRVALVWAPLRRGVGFALILLQRRLWFVPVFWWQRIEPSNGAVWTCCRQYLFRVRRFTFPLLAYSLHSILVSS